MSPKMTAEPDIITGARSVRRSSLQLVTLPSVEIIFADENMFRGKGAVKSACLEGRSGCTKVGRRMNIRPQTAGFKRMIESKRTHMWAQGDLYKIKPKF
jgi:hypothetical protein